MLCAKVLLPPKARVKILVDNTTVMATTRKTRSNNFNINRYISEVLQNFNVSAIEYIPSSLNPADNLSRGQEFLSPTDWQLLVKATSHTEMAKSGAVGLKTDFPVTPHSPVLTS
jgi:hypothetical protein